ncbi:MAG: hypothetical protein HY904_23365 [Deltaproteobacteria bacterium]|nr:hypothetical protein [Deltaproteobacteria bacterium]
MQKRSVRPALRQPGTHGSALLGAATDDDGAARLDEPPEDGVPADDAGATALEDGDAALDAGDAALEGGAVLDGGGAALEDGTLEDAGMALEGAALDGAAAEDAAPAEDAVLPASTPASCAHAGAPAIMTAAPTAAHIHARMALRRWGVPCPAGRGR